MHRRRPKDHQGSSLLWSWRSFLGFICRSICTCAVLCYERMWSLQFQVSMTMWIKADPVSRTVSEAAPRSNFTRCKPDVLEDHKPLVEMQHSWTSPQAQSLAEGADKDDLLQLQSKMLLEHTCEYIMSSRASMHEGHVCALRRDAAKAHLLEEKQKTSRGRGGGRGGRGCGRGKKCFCKL